VSKISYLIWNVPQNVYDILESRGSICNLCVDDRNEFPLFSLFWFWKSIQKSTWQEVNV